MRCYTNHGSAKVSFDTPEAALNAQQDHVCTLRLPVHPVAQSFNTVTTRLPAGGLDNSTACPVWCSQQLRAEEHLFAHQNPPPDGIAPGSPGHTPTGATSSNHNSADSVRGVSSDTADIADNNDEKWQQQ